MSTTSYANDITAGITTIEAHDCANCGVVFGLDTRFAGRRRKDGRGFYCPNGHVLSWEKAISLATWLVSTRTSHRPASRHERPQG